MEKGQLVKVIGLEARVVTELVGGSADFGGKIIAVNPTVEEYAGLCEEFAMITDALIAEERLGDLQETLRDNKIVYYDNGSGRPFIVEFDDVEIIG